jgi:hypothetical protein
MALAAARFANSAWLRRGRRVSIPLASLGAVQASGVIYAQDKVELVRAILAKHIIAAAKDGERDHGRLRDGALVALAQSNL